MIIFNALYIDVLFLLFFLRSMSVKKKIFLLEKKTYINLSL